MIRVLLFFSFFGMLFTGCKKTEASFEIDKTDPKAGQFIQFTNTSTNSFTAEWNFGDGTSSTLMNPVKVYDKPGSYLVSLHSYTKSGKRSSEYTQTIIITEADFYLNSKVDGLDVKHFKSADHDLYQMHDSETSIDTTGGPSYGKYLSMIGDGVVGYFGVRKGTLTWTWDSLPPFTLFSDFFKKGVYNYSTDAYNGIEVLYFEEGVRFSSSGGNQTGSTFEITESVPDKNTGTVHIKSKFTCRVYSNNNTNRTITGTYSGSFRNF